MTTRWEHDVCVCCFSMRHNIQISTSTSPVVNYSLGVIVCAFVRVRDANSIVFELKSFEAFSVTGSIKHWRLLYIQHQSICISFVHSTGQKVCYNELDRVRSVRRNNRKKKQNLLKMWIAIRRISRTMTRQLCQIDHQKSRPMMKLMRCFVHSERNNRNWDDYYFHIDFENVQVKRYAFVMCFHFAAFISSSSSFIRIVQARKWARPDESVSLCNMEIACVFRGCVVWV